MPVGLTGVPRTEEEVEGIGAGTGKTGDVRDGEGSGVVLGTEMSDLERDDENISAVRAAPAPAEVAAMMAKVVFDIFNRDANQIWITQRVRDQCLLGKIITQEAQQKTKTREDVPTFVTLDDGKPLINESVC
jgi:hypothetical protein